MRFPAQRPELIASYLVAQRLGVAEPELHRRAAAGSFPRPVRVAGYGLAWRRADLEAWEQRQVARRRAAFALLHGGERRSPAAEENG